MSDKQNVFESGNVLVDFLIELDFNWVDVTSTVVKPELVDVKTEGSAVCFVDRLLGVLGNLQIIIVGGACDGRVH